MKNSLHIFLFLFLAFISCDKLPVEKPKNLVKEGKMIDMLVDIHIAEETYTHVRFDTTMFKSTSADFYYSILKKYEVQDSIFEKSFVFYVSTPRKFEKMYREVMNKLSEIEQNYSGRKEELLEFDMEKR